MRELTGLLRLLAAKQHGVVAAYQARPHGTRAGVRHEFESERWDEIQPGVFRLAGAPPTKTSLAISRLFRAGPGAVVSHYSALALFGIPGIGLDPLHITRMRGSNGVKLRRAGIVAHESRRLPPAHITTYDGFVSVTPSRALADVARTESRGRLERWLDWFWSRRLVNPRSAWQVIEDLQSPGRPELRKLVWLLAHREEDYVAPASGLESRMNSILGRAGLPKVRRQVNLGGRDWLARVDFKVDRFPLVIEVQSDTYHAALSSAGDDAARFAALGDAGFRSVPVDESLVWHNPDEVVACIELALAELRR